MRKMATALLVLAALLIVSVLISLIPSDKWFIRRVDLVREPMSYIAALLLIIALFVEPRWRWASVAMLAAVITINVWHIWPYSALAVTQVEFVQAALTPDPRRCFSAMSVNVKVKNNQYSRMADQLRRYDPDLLFLMETDERWIEALEPVLARYDHVQRHPQPEAFGLVFATRLPVLKSKVLENTHRDTPTLYATIQPKGSLPIEFIGLHPKPHCLGGTQIDATKILSMLGGRPQTGSPTHL